MTLNTLKKAPDNSNIGFIFIALYTVILFIRPQEWGATPLPFSVPKIFIILAFLAYLFFQRPKIWGYQGSFLSAIVVVIILSGLRNGWFMGGITQAIDFIIYGLLPFLLYSALINTLRKQFWIFLILIVASCIIVQHGISQKLSFNGIGWAGVGLSQGTRITYLGFMNDPNDLGMFLVMNIPIAFYLKESSNSFLVKIFYQAALGGILYGIFLTNSRGALLGTFSLVLTYFYFKFGKIKTIITSLIILPVAIVVMSKFREIDSEEASAHGRIEAWYEGIQMFKYRPLVGIGKGDFTEHHFLTAHNSFVLIMAELGVLGYTLWFMTIVLSLKMMLRVMGLNHELYETYATLKEDILSAKCLFFSLIGFLTTAFFLSRSYIVFLYMFLGLMCAVFTRVAINIPEINDVLESKKIFKLIGLSLISLLCLQTIITILL